MGVRIKGGYSCAHCSALVHSCAGDSVEADLSGDVGGGGQVVGACMRDGIRDKRRTQNAAA